MNIDVEFHIRHNYLWARLPASVKQVAPCGRPHLLAAGSGVWGEVAARPCPARPCPALPCQPRGWAGGLGPPVEKGMWGSAGGFGCIMWRERGVVVVGDVYL